MKRYTRLLAPAMCLLALAACAGETTQYGAAAPHQATECKAAGDHCRWDGQCCSGRCYVDTGCSG